MYLLLIKFVAVILFFTVSCFPQIFLSGEIKGAYPRNNYIITGNLSVKFGDTLIFEPGSELRFEPNTGLEIRGVFIAKGTIDNSIIFTSTKDQVVISKESDNKDAFFWKGIETNVPTVIIRLSYCLFCYCESAISIKKTLQEIELYHVVFHQNKSSNLMIAGKSFETMDDIEYIYHFNSKEIKPSKNIAPIKMAIDVGQGLKTRWKILLRTTSLATLVSGTGLIVYNYNQANKYQEQYRNATDIDVMKDKQEKRDYSVSLVNTGIAVVMSSVGAFIITFIF
jgi:hypothetical protein